MRRPSAPPVQDNQLQLDFEQKKQPRLSPLERPRGEKVVVLSFKPLTSSRFGNLDDDSVALARILAHAKKLPW